MCQLIFKGTLFPDMIIIILLYILYKILIIALVILTLRRIRCEPQTVSLELALT